MSIKPEFKKFNSLENSYRENFIHKIREHGYENEEYIITEKLHGASYSFTVVVEGGIVVSVIPAKRSGYIHSDEKFYNHRPVYEKYVDKVSNLALCLLKDKNMSDGVVTVYGELYGGNIQGGMAYPLEQDFAGFDITINGTPIDKRKAFSLMNEYEIPTVPVLGVAPSLSDSLVHNESFVTNF